MLNKNKNEFYSLIEDIISNEDFIKTKHITHHGIERYNHLLRVSYYTYIITKKLHLNYVETTRAAVVHDFFFEEQSEKDNKVSVLRRHPSYAVENASKIIKLSDLQEDIIRTHMFPVTFTPPKYLESWVVDIIDDFAGIYEKAYSLRTQISAATTFMAIFLINYFMK